MATAATAEMSTTDAFDFLDPSGDGGFVCPECGQSYSRAEYLRRHQRKHNEARPFPCADCNKTFARSDVLLRHRRRVHPEEAAKEEAAKPAPAATGPKKPSATRRRNRNARRPYPAPAKADSAESDADSPEPDSGLTNGASTSDSPSNGLPGSSSSTGGAGFELFADLPKAPELGWSPPDSTPSGSSSSSSPNNGEGSGSKQPPYMLAPPMTPAEKEAAMQRIMNGETIPPAANISPLEAGAVSWALNSLPSLEHLATGEDRRISGLPEDLNGLVNNRRAQDFKEKTLNLPFVSPDLAIVAEQYLSELNPQQRGADANGNGATGSVDGGWNGMTWGNMLDADLSNLDPLTAEYAMLDSERRLRQHLSGDISINQGDKFYIPPGLFAGCYTVPHWLLPPLQRLSDFASNSVRNIGSHLGLIHEPTFRLASAHAWLAFSLCTAAGHQPYKTRKRIAEPEPWDAVQSVVRTEKTGMFVKLFARAGSKLPPPETFAGIQSLLIYNAQSFLSDNASDRLIGDLFLSTIAKIARRSGVFETDSEWAKPNLKISADIANDWTRWVRSESRRRTIWIVYILDTQSSLEASAVPLVSPRDVRHLPIPAPDSFWNATSPISWGMVASHPTFSVFTLDDAMQKLFDFSGDDLTAPTTLEGQDVPVSPSVLDVLTLGAFARLVMIITILRGLIDYGEGNHKGGYVVQRWVIGGQNGHGHARDLDNDSEAFHEYVMKAFNKALSRWKNGWDFDSLCPKNTLYMAPEAESQPIQLFHQDALPFYWTSQILLTHMSGGPEGGENGTGTAAAPRRWVDDVEAGEGHHRLRDVDLAATYATAKGVADPFTMG